MTSRRHFLAGAAAFPAFIPFAAVMGQSATPAATPDATPAATPAMPPATSAEIVPAWLDAQNALRQKGEAASAAFMTNDLDALLEVSSADVAAALQADFDVEELIAGYTRNQIQFAFHDVGAWFFGQYSAKAISGTFVQGGVLSWEAVPDEPQSGNMPSGTWTGRIGPGVIDLGIKLEFSGDASDLAVSLSIPSQLLINQAMTNVVIAEDLPLGEMTDQRVLPAGGDVTDVNLYGEQYAWGENSLTLQAVWNAAGELAGLQLLPQGALPEVETPEPIVARLPFDGAWMVFWGGETEFRNYHAVTPMQRHALDIAMWRDGATAVAPGTDNEHYHAFGQPYLSPVSGTVVSVLDGLEDIAPQSSGNASDHPAGNHIVIECQGGFVFLAHSKKGSILVQEGDTVEIGDVVAAVGNSGNTSEPHVHIHAQTRKDLFDPAAVGIPLVFEQVLENDELQTDFAPQQGTIVENAS